MKKLLTFGLVLLLFASTAYCVAIEKVTTTSVTFYNFSGAPYDLTNHMISTGSTFTNANTLTSSTGSLIVSPGQSVTLTGLSPADGMGSVALWLPGTNSGNAVALNMIDFVQYGSTGETYVTEAVSAGLWTTSTFAPGDLPICRTDASNGTGNGTWEQPTSIQIINASGDLSIGPNPFTNHLQLNLSETLLNELGAFDVYLTDMTGKQQALAVNQLNGSINLNTDALPAGMYAITLQGRTGLSVVRKLAKH